MKSNLRVQGGLRLLPIVMALWLPHAAKAADDFAARCQAVAQFPQPSLKVTQAAVVDAGRASGPGFAQPGGETMGRPPELPRHCLLQARFEQRTGVRSVPYSIQIELRVPEDWTGRLLFQGGGRLNGSVPPAIGSNPNPQSTFPPALARGFAVVSTDTGHEATGIADASFARGQEVKLNFAYAAIGKVASRAKDMIVALAGRAPDHSYFAGCSNGDREGMLAAQRYPDLFDGVVAGDSTFNLSNGTILSYSSKEIGAKYGPFDVALLETGAYDKQWPDIHMQPEPTLQAFLDLKGRWLLPVHNGTFDLALHRWQEPFDGIVALAQARGVLLATPEMGEPLDSGKPQAGRAWRDME
jgi:feruloyl esterase